MADEGLIACYWTLAGSKHGTPARFSFDERVAAAAKAGFGGIGLRYDDFLLQRERGRSDAELRRVADDAGIGVPELEFLYGWSSDDASLREESRRVEEALYAAAQCFGSRHVNVGCSEPIDAPTSRGAVVERFASLCERAAAQGLIVALEFMPWSAIPTASIAWEIVEAAGQANGGVLVDAWHVFRGDGDVEALRRVPADRIVAVQLDDCARECVGPLREDSLRRRRLPGEGDFGIELRAMLSVLREMGVVAPVGVEMIADSNEVLSLGEMASRGFAATWGVMRAVSTDTTA